jgi:protein-S-isoprenylcysteine O-methyltransferase Ste14
MLPALALKAPPLLVALGTAAAMSFSAWVTGHTPQPTTWGLVTAATLTLVGVGAIAIAIQNLRQAGTTVSPLDPNRTTELVTEGIYSTSRNPIYLGLLTILLALAKVLDSGWLYFGPLFFFAFIDYFQIRPEEQVLAEKYGAAFASYRSRVRRWV